ncbi:MAG: helix-turn-helix transcriptional regulator [Erysipelotrichaceae bacterium]|nr:helix-turn-helix transcriptional regulator [Erysipelotrichaceae bacterium]
MKGMGSRILKLMKENELTQRELAKMAGVTETAMSRYIKDEREPKPEIIANIATGLGTTIDYLITGENDNNSFENIYRLVARSSSALSQEEKFKIIEVLTKR